MATFKYLRSERSMLYYARNATKLAHTARGEYEEITSANAAKYGGTAEHKLKGFMRVDRKADSGSALTTEVNKIFYTKTEIELKAEDEVLWLGEYPKLSTDIGDSYLKIGGLANNLSSSVERSIEEFEAWVYKDTLKVPSDVLSGNYTFSGNFSFEDTLLEDVRKQVRSGSVHKAGANNDVWDAKNKVLHLLFCFNDAATEATAQKLFIYIPGYVASNTQDVSSSGVVPFSYVIEPSAEDYQQEFEIKHGEL